MRKSLFAVSLLVASSFAFAQASGGAQKTDVKGNTNINAVGINTTAVAVGEGNTAKNSIGAIKGGTSIKGNTNINAVGINTTAVAVGKNNTATNDVGAIGGK
jgi:hypothetical protein